MGLTYILPIEVSGETFPIIWSILGSALFAVAIGLLSRGKDQLKK